MHAACGSLRPWFRSATYAALFGLVAVTGIRIGEALAIPAGGIDLDAGLLPVHPAKSRCERILPLHPTTVAALAAYEDLRARKHPSATTFFVSIRGTRLCHHPVLNAFREACALAGIPGRPRIHDLRHSLAVNTLLDWYRSGEDIDAAMPALSCRAHAGHPAPFRRFALRIPPGPQISGHLAPFALRTAFPSSLAGRYSRDYYEAAVALVRQPHLAS